MRKKTTRLQFTGEELENPTVAKAAAKAERAADRADKAKEALPTKESKLRHEETQGSQREAQLRFGKKVIQEEKASAKQTAREKMKRGASKAKQDAPPTRTDDSGQFTRPAPGKAKGKAASANAVPGKAGVSAASREKTGLCRRKR